MCLLSLLSKFQLDQTFVGLFTFDRKSWFIRIGSFSEKANAKNLLKKLKLIKYQVYIIKINKDNEDLYAVNVGPYFLADNVKKAYLEIVKRKDYKDSYIVESNFKK